MVAGIIGIPGRLQSVQAAIFARNPRPTSSECAMMMRPRPPAMVPAGRYGVIDNDRQILQHRQWALSARCSQHPLRGIVHDGGVLARSAVAPTCRIGRILRLREIGLWLQSL